MSAWFRCVALTPSLISLAVATDRLKLRRVQVFFLLHPDRFFNQTQRHFFLLASFALKVFEVKSLTQSLKQRSTSPEYNFKKSFIYNVGQSEI